MRLLAGGLVLVLGIVGYSMTLLAHAYLVQADPPAGAVLSTSPETVTFIFSEEIEPQFSSFTLYDAQGQRLQELAFTPEEGGLRVVVPVARLSDGVYTVAWRVLSAVDGHVTKGVYPFGVGVHTEPGAPTPSVAGAATGLDPVRVLSRWLHYLSLGALVGMFFFSQIILTERSFVPALWILWGLAMLTSFSELFLYARSVADGVLSAKILFGTQVGRLWLVRVGLLAIVGVTLLGQGTEKRLWGWIELALSAGALVSGTLGGHSAASRELVAIVLDGAHLLAVAIWTGSLLALGLLLRRNSYSHSWSLVLPRFSRWALLSVLVIVGSGVYLSFKHVGSVLALWSTDYGRFLLLKIALLTAILAMAALNFRQVRRDFRGAYDQTDLAPLRLRVWGEFFTIVLVLGAAGALTLSPSVYLPLEARQAEPPTVLVHETEEFRITLTISSLHVGPAHFVVQIRDMQGEPTSSVQRVTLEFLYTDSAELGALSASTQQNSAGDFEVHGSYLSLAGRWQIAVQVRLSDRDEDVKAVFEVRARG
jgi:copper transport protein